MAELNSQISALLSLGADAMDNMFDVRIRFPIAVLSAMRDNADLSVFGGETQKIDNAFTLRCQGFEPPHFVPKSYEIRYKTVGVKKPAARIDGDRVFKLQFRLDAYYSIYRGLMAWRGLTYQPSTGFATNNVSTSETDASGAYFGTVDVVALDSPVVEASTGGYKSAGITSSNFYDDLVRSAGLRWFFDSVWIMDLEDPKFKTGGGDVMYITATFGFGEFKDPQMEDIDNSATYSIIPSAGGSGEAAGQPPAVGEQP